MDLRIIFFNDKKEVEDCVKILEEKKNKVLEKQKFISKLSGVLKEFFENEHKNDIVKVEKPIVFKTPSGKVVLLAEQKKAVEKRKDKNIKGMKIGEKK